MTIADTIKAARQGQGLSIQGLADKAGVDRPTLSRIEGGQLDRALQALGVELGGAPVEPTLTAPLNTLDVDPCNPRTTRDPDYIAGLAASIKEQGVLVPLLVRPNRLAPGRYLVPDGGCRLAALALLVGQGQLPADCALPIVVRDFTDAEALLAAAAAGLREDLNPMDECEFYLKLADAGIPTADVAEARHKTPRHINARIQLAQHLPDKAKAALREGKIMLAQAEALLQAEEKGDQDEALLAIAEGQLKTEADVRRFLADKKWQRQAARERKAHEDFKNAKGGATEDKLEIPTFLKRADKPAPAVKPTQLDIENIAPSPCRPKVEAAKAAKAAEKEAPAHPNAPTEQELAIHKHVCKELVIVGVGWEPMNDGAAPFSLTVWHPGSKRRIEFYAERRAPKSAKPVRRVKRRG